MNYTVRPLEKQDKEQFLQILFAYVQEYIPTEKVHPVQLHPDIAPVYWNYIQTKQDTHCVVVAESNDTLVGFCVGEVHFFDELESLYYVGDRRGDAWDLYTAPDFRGKGVGSALLQGLEKEFKKRGCEHMILNNVDRQNHGAIKLYESLGYTEWTVRFYKKIS